MSKEVDQLISQVASNAAVMQDAAAVIAQLTQKIPGGRDDDPTRLTAVIDAMSASSAALSAAIATAKTAIGRGT